MEHVSNNELNNDFRTCLSHLKEFGFTSAPRGQETKEILNYNITLTNPRNRIINFPARKTNLKYLLGELFWYLSGDPSPNAIIPYSKFWGTLRDEDGEVNSNYGTRLFGVHDAMYVPSEMAIDTVGFNSEKLDKPNLKWTNQWKSTIDLLAKDPNTRQAIQNIHMPFDRYPGNKDVPCTLNLHWFIRDNKLNLIVSMRSNDIILGFTNDVFQFTMLQEMMMLHLREHYPDLQLGAYYHNANSMHCYAKHYSMMDEIISDERALELSMIEMDDASELMIQRLLLVEEIWRENGCSKDYNFDQLDSFNALTDYWKNLIKMCFTEDEDALTHMFGIDHTHSEE